MKTRRFNLPVHLFLACGLSLAVLGGCAKKTPVTDQSQVTPAPGSGTDGSGATDANANPDATPDGGQVDRSLNDVFYNFDDYSLSEEARTTLSGNASYLKEMSGLRVMIEGHCDERGTVEYNLALGQRRADAARSYLSDLGVDAGRMQTISYGEERPFESGSDESAWSQNRRAHFRVLNP